MVVLTVILSLLTLLLLWLLLMPVILFIDTSSGQYFLQLKGLAKASVEGHEEEMVRIRFNVLGFKWYFYPIKAVIKKRDRKKNKEIKRRSEKQAEAKRRRSFKRDDLHLMLNLVRSFKVHRFFVNIDTGDVVWNAKLYPLCALFRFLGGNLHVNFQGRNQLALHIENRPINIIRSFINSKL